jgi:trimeric autotransporter adhesin
MAKTKISEWDSSAAGNTDINGININEGCPPSTINNAIRETMAQVKDLQSGASGDTIPVLSGGTGSATASGARTNLGLGTIATQAASAVAITGGTANGLTSVATGTLAATGTTTLSGAVTSSNSLNVTGTMLVDGASGTSGQYLTSAGTGTTPSWTTLSLGTMSSQNANAIAITGGTLSGVTVGGVTIGTNASGTKTVSTSSPTGGSDGDLWYKYIP